MRHVTGASLEGVLAAIFGAVVVVLAGCQTVGPHYEGPPPSAVVNAPAAQGRFVGSSDAAFATDPLPAHWWRLYDSQELDELVDAALKANTDLRAAQANLERSQALVRQARAARQLSAEVNVAPSYQQLSASSYLYPGTLSPLGLYDAGVSVSYEVDLFGRLKRAIEAAVADDEAIQAAYDLTKITVAAETARAYADACDAGEELAVTGRSLQLQAQITQTTYQLVEAGRVSRLDLTRSTEQLAEVKATIPTREAAQTNALYRLAALTGRPPAEYPKSVEMCTSAPRLRQALPIGDATALLRHRPDVREAERELAAATARIGVATADLYPRITLGASVGSTGAIDHFLSTRTNRYGTGLGIHWEMNQSMARARIAEANAGAKLALAHFDGVVLTALRDTETALATYSHDIERDEDLALAQAGAREAERQARQLYLAGKVDFLNWLDAQRSLTAAEDAVAVSHAKLSTDQISIFLALGG